MWQRHEPLRDPEHFPRLVDVVEELRATRLRDVHFGLRQRRIRAVCPVGFEDGIARVYCGFPKLREQSVDSQHPEVRVVFVRLRRVEGRLCPRRFRDPVRAPWQHIFRPGHHAVRWVHVRLRPVRAGLESLHPRLLPLRQQLQRVRFGELRLGVQDLVTRPPVRGKQFVRSRDRAAGRRNLGAGLLRDGLGPVTQVQRENREQHVCVAEDAGRRQPFRVEPRGAGVQLISSHADPRRQRSVRSGVRAHRLLRVAPWSRAVRFQPLRSEFHQPGQLVVAARVLETGEQLLRSLEYCTGQEALCD
mmetsp:Transcript_3675/g.8850  ORF Transcript_3675/g.8850 Transcript_3675/m.8850 type:complete len:303 (-) Transcript_3675:740-1648(-)